MRKPKVYVFLPAKNEEKTIRNCLDSLLGQTLKPSEIFVINDGSVDRTKHFLEVYDYVHKVHHVNLPFHKESYVATPELNWKMATVLNHAFPTDLDYDYLMQHSPDTVLPSDYIENLVSIMEKEPKLVIASGMVEDEPTLESHVRGVGRIYKMWFWERYIKRFPLRFIYESYPLYKARSLGFQVRSFPHLIMKTQRHTKLYKTHYGYAMRELGYFPPYALMRSLLSLRQFGVKLLRGYIFSPFKKVVDREVESWLRRYQIGLMLNFWKYARKWRAKI